MLYFLVKSRCLRTQQHACPWLRCWRAERPSLTEPSGARFAPTGWRSGGGEQQQHWGDQGESAERETDCVCVLVCWRHHRARRRHRAWPRGERVVCARFTLPPSPHAYKHTQRHWVNGVTFPCAHVGPHCDSPRDFHCQYVCV